MLVEVVQSFLDHNPWDVTREKQSPDINAVQPSGTINITRVYRTHSPSPPSIVKRYPRLEELPNLGTRFNWIDLVLGNI